MYLELDPKKIAETTRILRARVQERFPDAGLAQVAGEIHNIAARSAERSKTLARPHRGIRYTSFGLVALCVCIVVGLFITQVRVTNTVWDVENFIGTFEAGLGSIVFLGAAVLFLLTIEQRVKRAQTFSYLSELRALAHIVDMHQLTKDPEPILRTGKATASSPKRTMTQFELSRYFDYCAEMLSLLSKIGALYVQAFPDPTALTAVDEIESLTTGLSRKIWQKIMILDRFADQGRPSESSITAKRHAAD